MKYNFFLLLMPVCIVALLSSCTNHSSEQTESNEASFDLIGKRVTVQYPELKAEIHYMTDSTLHWRSTDLQNTIAEGDEKISYKRISNNQFFINWIEKDGTTISQVVEPTKGKVHVYMSFADKNSDRGQRNAILMEGVLSFD